MHKISWLFVVFITVAWAHKTSGLHKSNALQKQSHKIINIELKRIKKTKEQKLAYLQFISEKQKVKGFVKSETNFNNIFLQKKTNVFQKNYDNSQYVAPVGIGSPPQFLDVVLDTGSTNFWINSRLCDEIVEHGYPNYDHTESEDFVEIGLELEVEFGTGIVDGVIN